MSGVYDKEMIKCHLCGKLTLHLTGWESEEPDVLDIQCTECFSEQNVSGPTKMIGGYRAITRHPHTMDVDCTDAHEGELDDGMTQ